MHDLKNFYCSILEPERGARELGRSGVDDLPPGIEKYDGTVYRQVILEVRICGNEASNGGITFGLCKYAIPYLRYDVACAYVLAML